MKRKLLVVGVLAVLLAGAFAPQAVAQQAAAGQQQPKYTMQEYNAYQAAANEKNPQQRAKLLEEFVAKYGQSELLPYIYNLMYQTYNELRDFAKVIEFADKMLTFGDKFDINQKLTAISTRLLAYQAIAKATDANAADMAAKTRAAATEGVKLVGQLQKPENATPEQFEAGKKQALAFLHHSAGFAAMTAKDYVNAVASYKEAAANNPADALTFYRMGVSYIQQNPANFLDGFWAIARSIDLNSKAQTKVLTEAQVKNYLRRQMLAYQQPTCENLIDAQVNDLMSRAANSPTRPEDYKIPSAADLNTARTETPVFIDALKEGGDKAKVVWIAFCGLDFPEVTAKVIEVAEVGDMVIVKAFTSGKQEEVEAATSANMEIKVVGQPDAKRLEKDQGLRFSGTLAGYSPDPFLITWEKAKVNAEDIPEAKEAPAKAPKKAPAKKTPPKKPGR